MGEKIRYDLVAFTIAEKSGLISVAQHKKGFLENFLPTGKVNRSVFRLSDGKMISDEFYSGISRKDSEKRVFGTYDLKLGNKY